MAPSYAYLFKGKFENDFLSNCSKTPLMWLRFIDDIFFIWTHSEADLLKFIQDINNVHPTVAFSHEYSKTRVNFLDVTLEKKL